MGRPKGSKNKNQGPVTEQGVTPEVNTTIVTTASEAGIAHAINTELDPERAEIIAAYEQSLGSMEPDDQPATQEDTAAMDDGAQEDGDSGKEDEKSSDEPVASVAEYTAVDTTPIGNDEENAKTKELKTVPYDALHEERERRKAAQAKARELEERLKTLEAQLTAKPQEKEDETYLSDEEKRVRSLEKEIAEIKARDRMREEATKQSAMEMARKELDKQVAETDAALAKEGYPGFQFLSNRVGDELRRLVQEDPDNVYLDTPQGWAKIYKEKVYPSIKGVFVHVEKEKLMADKKAAKADAALIGSTGQKPPTTKKDDSEGYSYDEYLAMRMKSGLYGQ